MDSGPGLHRNHSGFTLTEIMIVVANIGLLASIAAPNFLQARTSARCNACINNLRLIQSAKDHYAIENDQTETITPAASDISPYLKSSGLSGGLPREPQGGIYSINAIDSNTTCDQAASLSHSV